MKKITFYIAAFFMMASMLVTQAQDLGRAPLTKANHTSGTISDVLRSVEDFGLATAGNTTTGEFGAFDLNTGAFTPAGVIGADPFPMAQEEGAAGVTYRVYNDASFVSVEIPSGVETALGAVTGMTGTPTGLAYNPADEMMYIVFLDGSNLPHLGTVDVATLVATEIGVGTGMIIGMDFAGDGVLYGPSLEDSLYSFDLTTGATTEIGALGVDINYGQDVTYDAVSDMLLTVTVGGAYSYGYYDLATGAFTELAPFAAEQIAVFSTSSLTEFPYVPPTGCTVYEDFEAGLPEGWSTEVLVGEYDWTFGTGDVDTGDDFPTNAAVFSDDDAGGGNLNTAILYSEVYDLVATNSTFVNFSTYTGFQVISPNEAFTIEVFDGTDWQQVAQYTEDFDPDLQTLSFDASAYINAAFQIRFTYTDNLDGTDDEQWGWFAAIDDFCLKYDEVPPAPENDAPENALPIACGGDVFGDTTNATIAEEVEDCDEFPHDITTSAGIWYTFDAEADMEYAFSTCGSASYDTSIGIYSGTPGSLVCEMANDDGDGCDGYSSNLTGFYGTAGETYYVRVYGYSPSSIGTFTMYMTCTDHTGIADATIDGFSMYPNPVEDTLSINATNNIEAITVFNLLGQEVLNSTPSATQVQLDMSHLPTGAYVVKVQAGDQVASYNLIKE